MNAIQLFTVYRRRDDGGITFKAELGATRLLVKATSGKQAVFLAAHDRLFDGKVGDCAR